MSKCKSPLRCKSQLYLFIYFFFFPMSKTGATELYGLYFFLFCCQQKTRTPVNFPMNKKKYGVQENKCVYLLTTQDRFLMSKTGATELRFIFLSVNKRRLTQWIFQWARNERECVVRRRCSYYSKNTDWWFWGWRFDLLKKKSLLYMEKFGDDEEETQVAGGWINDAPCSIWGIIYLKIDKFSSIDL